MTLKGMQLKRNVSTTQIQRRKYRNTNTTKNSAILKYQIQHKSIEIQPKQNTKYSAI